MAVDSSAFTVVFCEGKPDSLDYLLLNRILPVGPPSTWKFRTTRNFNNSSLWQAER